MNGARQLSLLSHHWIYLLLGGGVIDRNTTKTHALQQTTHGRPYTKCPAGSAQNTANKLGGEQRQMLFMYVCHPVCILSVFFAAACLGQDTLVKDFFFISMSWWNNVWIKNKTNIVFHWLHVKWNRITVLCGKLSSALKHTSDTISWFIEWTSKFQFHRTS